MKNLNLKKHAWIFILILTAGNLVGLINYPSFESCIAQPLPTLELRLPLQPGEWLISNGADDRGFHVGKYSLDIGTGSLGANVLAAQSGTISRVFRTACDAEGRDLCELCDIKNRNLEKVASYYDRLSQESLYSTFGNHVIIEHDAGYRTIYAHLRCNTIPPEIGVCSPDKLHACEVKQGELLGRIGTSGASELPHLHLQVEFATSEGYSPNIDVPELSTVSMEGQNLTGFSAGHKYTSTNRPGIDFSKFEVRDIPSIVTTPGHINAKIDLAIRNNSSEPRYLGLIELKGQTDRGNSSQILGNWLVGVHLQPGSERTNSIPVQVDIPANFVGDFRIFATITVEDDREVQGNLTHSFLTITDPSSILVDDDSADFHFNTADNINHFPSGGATGGGTQYTFTGSEHVVGTWSPANLREGRYEVKIFVPRDISRAPKVNYEVVSADPKGEANLILTSLEIDQQASAGRWITLGHYFFDNLHSEVRLKPIKMSQNYRVGYDAVLFRYIGELDDFSDIDAQDWFYSAANSLQNLGIVTGRQDNLFEPNAPVTRAEFLKMAMEAASFDGRRFYLELDEYPPSEVLPLLFWLRRLTYPPFSDVTENDWFFSYANLGYYFDIIDGREDGTFGPNEPTERAEAMKIVTRSFNFDDCEGTDHPVTFTDISTTDWHFPFVRLLHKFDIVGGYQDNTLKPNATLNRAEAAALIARTINSSHKIAKNPISGAKTCLEN